MRRAALGVVLTAAAFVAGSAGLAGLGGRPPAAQATPTTPPPPSTGSPTSSSTGSPTATAPTDPVVLTLTNIQNGSAGPLNVAGNVRLTGPTGAGLSQTAPTTQPAATQPPTPQPPTPQPVSVSDATVRLGIGAAVENRGRMAEFRDNPGELTGTSLVTSAAVGTIPVGGAAVRFALPPVALSSLPFNLGRSQFAVYPLSVTVTGTLGGQRQTLARAVTFLVWAPDGSVSQPTGIALVLPLADRPHLAANGTSLLDNSLAAQVAPGGRLARLLAAVAPNAAGVAPAVSLAVDPETVRAIDVMATGPYTVTEGNRVVTYPRDGDARAFLDDLKAFAAAKGSVLALPYGDPDVVALTRVKQYYQVQAAILRGSEWLGTVLGTRPTGTVALPPGGVADEATLDILRRAVPGNGGIRTVVLSDAALPPRGDLSATPPAGATVQAGKGTLRAVVADGDLAKVVAEGQRVPFAVARQNYLAETAMITDERPGAYRPQVIVLPRDWNPSSDPSANWLRTVLSGLKTQWSAAVPLQQVASAASEPSDRTVLTYPPSARSAELGPDGMATTADLRNQVVALHSVLCGTADAAGPGTSATAGPTTKGNPSRSGGGSGAAGTGRPGSPGAPTPPATASGGATNAGPVTTAATQRSCSKTGGIASMMDALVASESAFFRSNLTGAQALRGQVSAEVGRLRNGIRLVASQKVTLTSRKGRVPVTLENDLDQTVSVQLDLSTPDRARLGSASVVRRTIGPQQKVQVEIEVHAESAGSFPVYISLLTPEGTPFKPGPPSLVLVRSTAYGIIATAITVCALGVLALAVVVRSVRRVRAIRVAHRDTPARHEDGPPNGTGILPAVGGGDRTTGGER
jgi:hypothetical protein